MSPGRLDEAGRAYPMCREGGVVEVNVALQHSPAPDEDGAVTLRVFLVWGVRFTRESIAQLLESDPSVRVVGECSSLSEAVVLNPALEADVLLVDARLPDGPAGIRHALEIAPGMRIIVSAVRETEDDIIAWAEAGVIGYIPATTARADFIRVVREIHQGEQICSGRVVTGLLRRIALGARRRPDRGSDFVLPMLTRRERQAAELIRSGLSDKEIARQLNISLATTKSHVHNLLGKLHVHRRSQVAEWLREYERPATAPPRLPLNS
jgi:two-component system, NarL family, nitrate/nitrite response regulator NarL